MEMGEGASVATIKIDPDKYLKAKVTEVSFNGTYKSCRSLDIIKAPHWPSGKPDGYNQSRKAAVLKMGKGETHTAKVKLEVDSKGVSGNGKLTGTLGKLVFEGQAPLASGTHDVTVTLKETPESLHWARGAMTWEINGGEHIALAGATNVELFFVFDDPAKKKFFNPQGVWVEALRFIFDNGKLEGVPKIKEGLSKVTKACFLYPHHKYEINKGAPNFGGASGVFQLTDYMRPKPGDVNCYDQTYAVVVFSGALGVTMKGLYLNPFGYLKRTMLVGWGSCNNPFPYSKYRDVSKKPSLAGRLLGGAKIIPKLEDFLDIDPTDPARSGFGNHMFCEYRSSDNAVYDACAGPAPGEHDSLGYMENSIDTVIPSRVRGYDEGIEKPWQVPVQKTGYPKNKKEIELNHKYCVSDIDDKGMGVDRVK